MLLMAESQNPAITAVLWLRDSGLWRKNPRHRPILTILERPEAAINILHGRYSITLGGKDREGKLFVPSESDC
jgi:hypothetical protein